MSYNNIPSDEDFIRAKNAMRKNDQGLSHVCEQILIRFREKGVYKVFLFFSPKSQEFGAYVFFRWAREIQEAEKSGLAVQIKDMILEELEKVGRGSRHTMRVIFEFDSHENVISNFEGDYYLRLR